MDSTDTSTLMALEAIKISEQAVLLLDSAQGLVCASAGYFRLFPDSQVIAVPGALLSPLLQSQALETADACLKAVSANAPWSSRTVTDSGKPLEITGTPLAAGGYLITFVERADVAAEGQELVQRLQETESQLLHANDRLELIQGIVRNLNAGMSIGEVVKTTLALLYEKFPRHRVSYSTVSEHGQLTVLECFTPENMPSISGVEADLSAAEDYLAGLRAQNILAVEDVFRDPRFEGLHEAMREGETHAVLDVPLAHDADLVGLICLDATQKHHWREEEIRTVAEVAEFLEVTIREAKSLQERKILADRLADYTQNLEKLVEERTHELAEAKTAAERLARTDPLTGLNNRRAFYQDVTPVFNLARRSGFSIAVLLVDIDHFKKINDTHGHDVGDRVICQVANALSETVRQSDIVARFGGEEFVVALPETEAAQAMAYAEKLRQTINALVIEGVKLPPETFTVSIGIAMLNVGLDTCIDAVVSKADKALYKVKNNGRNNFSLYQ